MSHIIASHWIWNDPLKRYSTSNSTFKWMHFSLKTFLWILTTEMNLLLTNLCSFTWYWQTRWCSELNILTTRSGIEFESWIVWCMIVFSAYFYVVSISDTCFIRNERPILCIPMYLRICFCSTSLKLFGTLMNIFKRISCSFPCHIMLLINTNRQQKTSYMRQHRQAPQKFDNQHS